MEMPKLPAVVTSPEAKALTVVTAMIVALNVIYHTIPAFRGLFTRE